MLRMFIGAIMLILVVLVVGTVVLEEFPGIQPLFDEMKMHVINLYNISLIKYGAIPTLVFIFGIFVLVGSSKKM